MHFKVEKARLVRAFFVDETVFIGMYRNRYILQSLKFLYFSNEFFKHSGLSFWFTRHYFHEESQKYCPSRIQCYKMTDPLFLRQIVTCPGRHKSHSPAE